MTSGDILKSGEEIQPPVLRLPEDEHRVEQLKAKKTEYEERLGAQIQKQPYMDPDLSQSPQERMKLAILNRLLNEGEVATGDLSLEFAEQNPGLMSRLSPEGFEREWNKAAIIIEDYCLTGGDNLYSGTGLIE